MDLPNEKKKENRFLEDSLKYVSITSPSTNASRKKEGNIKVWCNGKIKEFSVRLTGLV